MEKFYHSPAIRGLRGMAHLLTVATDASVGAVSAISAGEKLALAPAGTREGLTLWQGSITPAPDAEALSYTLYADLDAVGSYTVPLADANLAPLAITELAANMKASPTVYLEVVNTTDAPIDLGGYQVMYQRVMPDTETPFCVMPIASAPGEAVLPPHEVGVLWLAYASSHNPKAPCLTAADFCARLEADYSWRGFRLAPDTIRIFRVEGAEQVEVDGVSVWRDKPGVVEFPKLRAWDTARICIAPLGGSFDTAVCRMTVNDLIPDEWDWHTPIRRASLWQPDPCGGADMRCVVRAADITPGTLDKGQVVANLDADRPTCVIPLDWPVAHPLADGALTLRFAAEGAGNCRIVLDAGQTVAAEPKDGIWSVTLPAGLLARIDALTGCIEADSGTYVTRLPLPTVKLIDNAGPIVTAFKPENGYAAEADSPVEFAVSYFDRAGIDAFASHLYLDGKEISAKAAWTPDGVRCTLEKLKPGKHKLALKLYDCLGNASRTVSYFTVAEPGIMYCYRGEVHAHTGDSDGVATPEDAVIYARDEGKADYFAVTDHGHYLSDDRYAAQFAVADRHNEAGKYAVLRGWEMTWNNETGYWGHINVLETEDAHYDIRDMDMPALFDYLAERPGSIGMFNHPGYNWGNFDDFGHLTPEADAVMCLNEIKGAYADGEHALSLARGWHLGPVSNEDNHGYNWTTATNQTGYVLAPGLSRQNVVEAMHARRTYTTSDPSLHLRFRINGAWLGARIPATDMLTVDVRLDTERPEGLGVVSLIGEDNITVAEWDLGAIQHFEQRIHVPCDFDYYYIKAINPVVPKDYTISAPVWIEGRDALSVTEMELSLTGGEQPNLVSVAIENSGEAAVTDLRADFYLTPVGGFNLANARPYRTVYLGKLGAGETARTARTFPNLANRRRVSVIVSGKIGKKRFVDTRYLLVTPASIVEALPESTLVTMPDGSVIADPYTYAVLFNHENKPLSLDGMALRQWTTTGKAPSPEHIHALDGITIPARMPSVFWFRQPDSPLTAADFCAHYGVELVEGEDLFILDGKPLSGSHVASRRLDLAVGAEVISRIHWNYAEHHGSQPNPDCALRYGYRGGMTATAALIDETDAPAPGSLIAEQMPAARIHQTASVELRRAKKANKKAVKQSRKPAKPQVKRGAAAAMTIGAATAGAAIGVGTTLLTVLLSKKGGRK